MEEIQHLYESSWSLFEDYSDDLELAYFTIVNFAEAEENESWYDFTMYMYDLAVSEFSYFQPYNVIYILIIFPPVEHFLL